MIEKSRIVPQV